MEETIVVNMVVQAIVVIDKEEWPEDWDLVQEMGEQLSIDDATEYTVITAIEVN